MKRPLLSLLIALSMLLTATPAAAQQPPALPQAEIAYVLDGDLWLYDTVSGASTRLTTSGGNQWPSWSPDARTLLYTHVDSEEEYDLYAYDIESRQEIFLSNDACCGGYAPPDPIAGPSSGPFAFVDLSGRDLVLRDGTGFTKIDPLEYGRSLWPAGALVWYDDGDGEGAIALPALIVEADAGSFSEQLDVIRWDSYSGEWQEGWRFGSGCEAVSSLDTDGVVWAVARYAPGDDQSCAPADSMRWLDAGDAPPRPNLSAPSLSPDGRWLAAERWSGAEAYSDQELEGIVLVEIDEEGETLIVEGGGQPAWRPSVAVSPAAEQARRPGERVVEIQPRLYGPGGDIRVAYYTTGSVSLADASFLAMLTPELIKAESLTGLLVTEDGEPVEDPDRLRELLALYTAAHAVYAEPVPLDTPAWAEPLARVLESDDLAALEPHPALKSARAQSLEAMLALLTAGRGDRLEALLDDLLAADYATWADFGAAMQNSAGAEDADTLIASALEGGYFLLGQPGEDAAFDAARYRLAAHLALALVRGFTGFESLTGFAARYVEGPAAFGRNEIRALSDLTAEFEQFEGNELPSDIGGILESDLAAAPAEATAEEAAALVTSLESRLVAHALAQALVALMVADDPAALLYAPDDVQARFTLAGALETLRALFAQGRVLAQEQLDRSAGQYDAGLTQNYVAYRALELRAAGAAARTLAAGVELAPRNSSLGDGLDADSLGEAADVLDAELANLTEPAWLAAAVELASIRARESREAAEATQRAVFTALPYRDEVVIPAGAFQMGCAPDDSECSDDERPLHEVTLDAYAIDKYEVTNARYQACVEAGECSEPASSSSWSHPEYYGNPEYDGHPVLNTYQYLAAQYCAWEGKRLPTEAEWEKAARGADHRVYPWGNEAPDDSRLNFNANMVDVLPVGSYPSGASPYGLMDMGGNVWEWVSDIYGAEYYGTSPAANPTGPEEGDHYVLRGGAWDSRSRDVRVSRRWRDPGDWYEFFGFRCARDATPEEAAAAAEAMPAVAAAEAMPAVAAPETAPAAPGPMLLIWADELVAPTLEALRPDFEAETGVMLKVEVKSYGALRDDFLVAAPAGEGPDILLGSHDWLGEFVSNGLVSTVGLGDQADGFLPNAVDAFTYDGELYGMPLTVENVAFFYNTDLVPQAPTTWDEVRQVSERLVDGGMRYGFVIQENDPYHFYGIQSAFGGYIFGRSNGAWDPGDLGIDSPGTIAAFSWLDGMYKDGLLDVGAGLTYETVGAAFNNGDAAMLIAGPWWLTAVRGSSAPFAVAPLPAGPAGPGRPFLSVRGLMISAFSKQPLLAEVFMQQYVTRAEALAAIQESTGRPSAFRPAHAMIDDLDLRAFAEAALAGEPMPNIPEMGAVWSAWGNAMQQIGQQAASPEAALSGAAEQIRSAMRE